MLKYDNCKCHPKWGPDDLVSIPALNGTVECNKFLCFNLSDIDRKKKKKIKEQNKKNAQFSFIRNLDKLMSVVAPWGGTGGNLSPQIPKVGN